ncbi:MAG: Uma2 family endonuclease [Cyanobacteria bacterium P01_A01_bin.116]
MDTLTLQFPPSTQLSDDQYYEFCLANRDIRIERNASGELILMPPTGGETGRRNASITVQLGIWNQKAKLGEVFDSSSGFKLPNGADRAPDASWVTSAKWHALTPAQKEKFPPICPDFVIELRSSTDRLSVLQAKMQEYIDNGARLGWLINRKDKQVEIYRPEQAIETLQDPSKLLGETVLPGFELELEGIL